MREATKKRQRLASELERHAKWAELSRLANLPVAAQGEALASPRAFIAGLATAHRFSISGAMEARIPEALPELRSTELAGFRRIILESDRFPVGTGSAAVFTFMVQWARSMAAENDRLELDAALEKITAQEIGGFELAHLPEESRPVVFALARIQQQDGEPYGRALLRRISRDEDLAWDSIQALAADDDVERPLHDRVVESIAQQTGGKEAARLLKRRRRPKEPVGPAFARLADAPDGLVSEAILHLAWADGGSRSPLQRGLERWIGSAGVPPEQACFLFGAGYEEGPILDRAVDTAEQLLSLSSRGGEGPTVEALADLVVWAEQAAAPADNALWMARWFFRQRSDVDVLGQAACRTRGSIEQLREHARRKLTGWYARQFTRFLAAVPAHFRGQSDRTLEVDFLERPVGDVVEVAIRGAVPALTDCVRIAGSDALVVPWVCKVIGAWREAVRVGSLADCNTAQANLRSVGDALANLVGSGKRRLLSDKTIEWIQRHGLALEQSVKEIAKAGNADAPDCLVEIGMPWPTFRSRAKHLATSHRASRATRELLAEHFGVSRATIQRYFPKAART